MCAFAVPAAHIMCLLCVEYLVCCSVEPVDEMQTHTHLPHVMLCPVLKYFDEINAHDLHYILFC